MRLFIAVNIPDEIKQKISLVQDDLRRALSDIKWVSSDRFHLTLKFLGEVDPKNADSIISGLKEAASGFGQFNMSFMGTGVFPDIHRPRVVWVGIKEGREKLKLLAEKIADAMHLLDFPKEKRGFSAHLTLGRLRSQKNKSSIIKKVIANEKVEAGSCAVKSVDLMQSFLHPTGPEYKCLESVSI